MGGGEASPPAPDAGPYSDATGILSSRTERGAASEDGLDLGFGEFDFHDKYAFVLLVYSGLCIVVAPNDDAKIRRWECGLRMGTKKNFLRCALRRCSSKIG